MSDESRTPVQGPVVEEQIEFTLMELSRACGADEEQITALIVEGVIEPIESSGAGEPRHPRRTNPAALPAARAQWRFSGTALRRARLATSLARDLEVNPPGVALALDLIDEIEALRAMLHRLGR
ncbi:MAG: MerR family transcriptional regulator [Burkholderiaceae bacterium]|nr:MerR family transcriptional regulator [Burkholderiaceae bacterium]MCD6671699.1 chaperone modulator CbpM [Burkholderiaceae bacterium]